MGIAEVIAIIGALIALGACFFTFLTTISTILMLLYFDAERRRKIEQLRTDIEIIHPKKVGYGFPRHLNFQLKNNGLGLARNINVKPESDIGDFEVTGHEKELPPQQIIPIVLDWKITPIPTHYEGYVIARVSYESMLRKNIFWKDKKMHEIAYRIKDGKVTIRKDGN